jgi:predicted component of type VI protein secretion system
MTWLEYNEALQELRADSEVVVGTGAQATWRLRRADLMPRHFIVAMTDDGVLIRPFSSEAVVTVNGRQLPCGTPERLHDGDVISAGSGEFRFWADAPGDSQSGLKAPVVAHLLDLHGQSALSLQRISTGIGSDESNALILDCEGASSFHAEVRREAGGHVLRVPESAAVTLNGHAVSSPTLLREGDEIGLADQRFRYTQQPLGNDIVAATEQRITSAARAEAMPAVLRQLKASTTSDLSSVVTLRTPMRAVAFVSSVIAAVAIATLFLMHHGP